MNSGTALPAMASIKREEPPEVVVTDTGGTGSERYHLNVNVNVSAASAVGTLLAAEGGATPRTPEILNSLIAMTSPLDQYAYTPADKCSTPGFKGGSCGDSNSSISTNSPATSPASGTPPSIQKTCSDLIKAGLKLSIESKRKMSGSECSESGFKRLKKEETPSDEDYDSGHTAVSKSEGLTPEDEERRRRRRERNKIAATKCRLKKRERTVNLVTESEVLETQNIDLKTQLQDLEIQRQQLLEMLSLHSASCVRQNNGTNNTQYNQMRPYESPGFTYDASPYIRPESADVLPSSYSVIEQIDGAYVQHIDEYHRPDSVLSIPNENNYHGDYLPKVSSLLVLPHQEYYDECYPEPNYSTEPKVNNGCLA